MGTFGAHFMGLVLELGDEGDIRHVAYFSDSVWRQTHKPIMILIIEEGTNYTESQLNKQGCQEIITENLIFKYGHNFFSGIEYLIF